jgi:hypothetical protein
MSTKSLEDSIGNQIRDLPVCSAVPQTIASLKPDIRRCLKRGAGEGWRIAVGPNVREMRKYYVESRRRGISCIQ